ncbi:hypothetical protein, partial [Corynebacterium nasicanis]
AVQARDLRPAASREDIRTDDTQAETLRQLEQGIIDGLRRCRTEDPALFARLVAAHTGALLEACATEDRVADMVRWVLPLRTDRGAATLEELQATGLPLRFSRTTDVFRSLAPLLTGQMILIDAARPAEAAFLSATLRQCPELDLALVDPGMLVDTLEAPDLPTRQGARGLLFIAEEALEPVDCRVELRSFRPATRRATYLQDPDVAGRIVAATAESERWSDILGVIDPFAGAGRPTLLLNAANDDVLELIGLAARSEIDFPRATAAVRAFYVRCLLESRLALSETATAWLMDMVDAPVRAALDDTH